MKNIKFLILLAASIAVIVLSGCVTKDPGTGVNGVPPHYSVDTNSINNARQTVQGVNAVTSPFNPYSPLVNPLAEGVLAVITLVSGLVAAQQNKKASTATAAADTLAEGVVKAGDTAKSVVLDHASNSPNFAAVANHINEATP